MRTSCEPAPYYPVGLISGPPVARFADLVRDVGGMHSDLRPLPYFILVLDSDGPQRFPEVCPFLASKSILHTALNNPSNYRTSIEGSVGGSPSNSSTDTPDVMPGSS